MTSLWWSILSIALAIAISLLVVGMGYAVLWCLFTGRIDLKYLLAEPADPTAQAQAQASGVVTADGSSTTSAAQPPEMVKASLSRFQFLIFTFVIAGVYLVLCLQSGKLLDIPQNVLILLGISGTTYAVSKGIKTAGDANSRSSDSGP